MPGYERNQQQDATEFLNGLIWKIHDHLQTQRQTNPLVECTKITTKITVMCSSCKSTSVIGEPSYLLHLTIQGESIEESLSTYNSTENLTGKNQYHCLRCQKLSDANKSEKNHYYISSTCHCTE